MTRPTSRATRRSERDPTAIDYRGLDVYGMAPPSSGGSTVGEALNILEGYDLGTRPIDHATHQYLEASRYSFADRGKWVGDPATSTCRSRACCRTRSPPSAAP